MAKTKVATSLSAASRRKLQQAMKGGTLFHRGCPADHVLSKGCPTNIHDLIEWLLDLQRKEELKKKRARQRRLASKKR